MKYELVVGVHIRKDLSDIFGGVGIGSDIPPLDVKLAQERLIKLGYDLGIEKADGFWSKKSEIAFQKYQGTGQNLSLDNAQKDLSNYSFEEYANLIKSLQRLFKNIKVAFLISSDTKVDLNYFQRLPIYLATGHFIEDNYSLSKCDYIIGPSSTFTYWSSFFGSVPLFPFASKSSRLDLSNDKKISIKPSDFKVYYHLF